DNGITCVQIRWKTATDRQLVDLARAIQRLSQPRGIPLIINDRLDIALVVGTEGVHLGVDDVPVPDARRVGEPEFLIGYSPETDSQIAGAAAAGASYLGIGPVYGTATKLDAGPALGTTEFTRRRMLTGLPVVAIGGITADNAAETMAAAADGVAVASAILGSADPAAATRQLRRVLPAHP
ncbi:MAG: thiamine phosphate synthase, partial [Chloroflexota bacterium]|nr:thiamine phosphate synthase [Chloroflexota bacterium]